MSPASTGSVNFEAIDITHQRLRLADDLAVWPAWENGRRIYRLERREAKRFYRVGFREYAFISLLNGETTVAGACGLAASKLGNEALTSDETESIAVWLIEERIASLTGEAGSDRSTRQGSLGPRRARLADQTSLLKRINPFWIQFPIVKNVQLFAPALRFMAKSFHPVLIACGILLIVAGAVSFVFNRHAVYDSASNLMSPTGWMSLLLTWVVLKIIHEWGHALACQRVGGETGELGIVLILFAPLAYVDVSSCWRLPRRSSRLIVSAAGMFVELSVASIAMLIWSASDDVTMRYWLANVVITAGVSTVLFNANPLMRFDGYYLLSDLAQIPNLSTEGSSELKRLGRWLFYGDVISGCHYRGLRRVFIVVYGVAAALWRLFICLILCISAAVMFSGAGVALAAFGVFAWFGKPIGSMLEDTFENLRFTPMRLARSIVVAVFIVSLAGIGLNLPIPTAVNVPAAVHDSPDSIIRAGSDGFVRQIHVRRGQSVRRGDPLFTLENRSLEEQVNQLRLSLEENSVLHRIATDRHDASGEWTAHQDRLALERKIQQMQPKVDALTIKAPKDGTIQTRELRVLMGQFVREGEEITRVVGPKDAEVIGLIHQDKIEIARKNLGQPVWIRDASYRTYLGEMRKIDPRASFQLPDQSLAAPLGGPLEVTKLDTGHREPEQHSFRLVAPHFLVRAELSPSDQSKLRAGSRVQIRLGYRNDSLAHRIMMALRHLWYETLESVKG